MRSLLVVLAAISTVACGGATTTGSSSGEPGTPGTPSRSASSSSSSSSSTETPASSEPAQACPACAADEVTWQWNGGLVAYVDVSHVTPCSDYRVERKGDEGGSTCTSKLVQCIEGGGDPLLGISQLNSALAHPDVKKALASAPGLYGKDDRPCDGAVLEITVGKSTIQVGGDCKAGETSCGGNPCSAVPAGLRSLATLLTGITEQEKSRPSRVCTQ